MNNKLKYLITTLFVFLAIGSAVAEGSVSIFLSGNMLLPADENYKQIYGSTKLLPEAKIGIEIVKGMSVWAGFGYLGASGTTPILMEGASSTQMLISGGVGYKVSMANRLGFSIRIGMLFAQCSETAMGETVNASAIGFVIGAGPFFNFSKNFGLEVEAGYSSASTTVEDIPIKVGGFKAGAGLTLSF